ncbi:hypothetical protein XM38_037150 [Halomicronema hongdechloris C2206]|uniref:Uncharacterized protein n=1 Tax=Halomicronema hongdechloris C2206 TaxID=1641165 RepID=A0A1Z3HR79_9CYAN|nr:hypothetical protein [Halomicronema hongdechloris]ASC72756.1 hypothetical protein XM38_037150 [Halomicronema hongdechloris C2206]
MLGTFQQSRLRIEVDASASIIRDSLLRPMQVKHWLWPQQFQAGLPDQLTPGVKFTSYVGPLAIYHHVDLVGENHLRLLMAGGIDGFHEWYWGDGWIQSCLEGISAMPLNLAQTIYLWRLKQYLSQQRHES